MRMRHATLQLRPCCPMSLLGHTSGWLPDNAHALSKKSHPDAIRLAHRSYAPLVMQSTGRHLPAFQPLLTHCAGTIGRHDAVQSAMYAAICISRGICPRTYKTAFAAAKQQCWKKLRVCVCVCVCVGARNFPHILA